jgi:molybdate transport system ATP-binding protein
MALLSFSDASIRKYDIPVLFDLNWEVNSGEQWAIIGSNGAGKTTLLETIAGRWACAQGRLKRQGSLEFVASDYSFNRIIKASAQYYQQRFYAYETDYTPTVREVLNGRLKPVGTVDEKSVELPEDTTPGEVFDRITGLLQLTDLLDHPFLTLSNGETRRMLLARSLLKTPDILLLDHPFAGLDVVSRIILKETLAHLAQNGTTILLSTSTSEIPNYVTHILELDNGRIVATRENSGTPQYAEPEKEHFVLPDNLISALGKPAFHEFEYAFRLRNLRVVYDGKAVLDNVSWDVKKGEKWALTGPNGSGKSTLLSIITADHPQRFSNDYDLFDQKRGGKRVSIWEIKQRIGHVSPELHLYFPGDTTVVKTISSGFFDATGVYFRQLNPQQVDQVHFTAEVLGISHLLNRTFKHLSKGEQRLVLLARALVKNPPLLILDEPCQGLDISAIEHFKAVVDAICDTPDRTLLYVSHYPHEIPDCVTKTMQLKAGRLE